MEYSEECYDQFAARILDDGYIQQRIRTTIEAWVTYERNNQYVHAVLERPKPQYALNHTSLVVHILFAHVFQILYPDSPTMDDTSSFLNTSI